jgi:uncharacterized protein YqgC (DUF456 family)
LNEALGFVVSGCLILAGLISIAIPPMPDMLLIWLGALAYGLLAGWGETGPWAFAIISALALVGGLAEILAGGAGAKLGGASGWSLAVGAGIGLLALIFMGPLGGIGGLLVGTYAMEYRRQRDAGRAMRGVLGLALGYGASFGLKLILGAGIAAVWLFWVIRD